MNSQDTARGRRRALPAVIAVVILLFPLGYSVASALFTSGGAEDAAFLDLPANRNEGCIRDLEYMRFRHMDLLTEMRDTGVRGGAMRQVTFTDCTECHVNRQQFCDRCHEAVNLEPDCFECHYYPGTVR